MLTALLVIGATGAAKAITQSPGMGHPFDLAKAGYSDTRAEIAKTWSVKEPVADGWTTRLRLEGGGVEETTRGQAEFVRLMGVWPFDARSPRQAAGHDPSLSRLFLIDVVAHGECPMCARSFPARSHRNGDGRQVLAAMAFAGSVILGIGIGTIAAKAKRRRKRRLLRMRRVPAPRFWFARAVTAAILPYRPRLGPLSRNACTTHPPGPTRQSRPFQQIRPLCHARVHP